MLAETGKWLEGAPLQYPFVLGIVVVVLAAHKANFCSMNLLCPLSFIRLEI